VGFKVDVAVRVKVTVFLVVTFYILVGGIDVSKGLSYPEKISNKFQRTLDFDLPNLIFHISRDRNLVAGWFIFSSFLFTYLWSDSFMYSFI
jgi:hypothetical protein